MLTALLPRHAFLHYLAQTNWTLFIGRFHMVLLHLPICLLLLLGAMEVVSRLEHWRQMQHARGFIISVTAVCAAATAFCGWLLATRGNYDPRLLFWHRWLGVAVAVLCVAAWASWYFSQMTAYYVLLTVAVGTMVVAAHFGGDMSNGSNYLTQYAPAPIRTLFGGGTAAKPVLPTIKPTAVYTDIVQPMFTQYCVRCHGPKRHAHGLRLDSLANVLDYDGAIVLGKPKQSDLLRRMLLPPHAHGRMPPGNRPRPSAGQIKVLQWWISRSGPHPAGPSARAAPRK